MRKALVAAGVLILLSGCATGQPVAAPDAPAETPVTEAPAPTATGIVIGGTEFSITFDDDSSESYSFASNADEAVLGLSAVLGDPVLSVWPGDNSCDASYNSSAWGGLILGVGSKELPDDQEFFLSASADAPLPVPVSSTVGLGVGDDGASVFDATPEPLRNRYDLADGSVASVVFFDMQDYELPNPVSESTDESTPWGGYVRATNGIVTHIVAPVRPAWDANC